MWDCEIPADRNEIGMRWVQDSEIWGRYAQGQDSEVVNGGVTHGNEGIKLVDVSQFCVAVEQQCCVVCVGYPLLMESLRSVNKDM